MEELMQQIREFDRQRGWNNYETAATNKEKIDVLFRTLVFVMGELGEFANEVKKCSRDNKWNEEKLKEELADTFIFLLKLSMALNMDLKQEVMKKIKINEERFSHFKKE